MRYSAKQQKGVALIIVLLIVAIVSVLATEMGTRLQLQVKRASNIKENNQAFWYAMGAEKFAHKSIVDLIKNQKTIHLNQPWNQEFTFPIEGGGIQAQLSDLQTCFNLNALVVIDNTNNPSQQQGGRGEGQGERPQGKGNGNQTPAQVLQKRLQAFQSLLEKIDAEIPSYNIEILRDSLADWLDKDGAPRALGAEDSEYESRVFPYMAANNLMVHKSELRLINGVEAEWINDVMEHICVLPNDPSFIINVNTLEEENAIILAAMLNIDAGSAKSALSARGEKGFEDIEQFLSTPEIQAANLDENQKKWFDITTSHFILHTKTKYNNATFSMQSVFKIDSKQTVSVIRREFSAF